MRLPSEVALVTLTREKIKQLWEKQRQHDALFDDSCRGKEEKFVRGLLSPDSIIFELKDGNGVMVLDHIIPGSRADAHLAFWDRKLSKRTEIVKQTLVWCFITKDLRRVQVWLPTYAGATRRFVCKNLGFTEEGILRNFVWYKGELFDVHVCSILREEVLDVGNRRI